MGDAAERLQYLKVASLQYLAEVDGDEGQQLGVPPRGWLARVLPALQHLYVAFCSSRFPHDGEPCKLQEVVAALAGHEALTVLRAGRMRCEGVDTLEQWALLLRQVVALPALQALALPRPSHKESTAWHRPTLCAGRGLREVVTGACSSSLRCLEVFYEWSGGWRIHYGYTHFFSVAEAMLLLGPGSCVDLLYLSLPVDLGLDVKDLTAGLQRLQEWRAGGALQGAAAAPAAAGQEVAAGRWLESWRACCGRQSTRASADATGLSAELAAGLQQQGQQGAQLQDEAALSQEALLLEQQVAGHLQRMLAAQELLEALQRAVRGRSTEAGMLDKATCRYQGSLLQDALAKAAGGAVQAAAQLVCQVEQALSAAAAVALPQGWRQQLGEGLRLRQELARELVKLSFLRGALAPDTPCYLRRGWGAHCVVGQVQGCHMRLIVSLQ